MKLEKTMKRVNSRPVWENSVVKEYIYFGNTKHWYLGSHDDMTIRGSGGTVRSKLKDLIEVPNKPYERLVRFILTNDSKLEWIDTASLITYIEKGNTISSSCIFQDNIPVCRLPENIFVP